MVKEGGGRFVAQSAAADLVAQRLRPRGSSRDRQPAGLVYSVRGSLYLEGWMRPKQTIEGTPEESRPDGERRAEVTKNLGEMVVGQQRRGDRGASVRTPAGMGSYDMNDWKLSSSRLQMLARSKEQVQRQGRRCRRDLGPCLQIHHVEAVGQERKCGGDGRGRPTEVWNVHGGPWCSLSASVHPQLVGSGNTGFSFNFIPSQIQRSCLHRRCSFRPDQGTKTRAGLPPFPRFSCRWPPSHESGTCRYHVGPRRPSQRWMKRPTAYQLHPSDVLASHPMCKRCAGSRRIR